MYSMDLQFFAANDKTEKATPKKREDVRKKGQTAKSQELVSALVFFIVFLTLSFATSSLVEGIIGVFYDTFDQYIFYHITADNIVRLAAGLLIDIMLILLPVFLAAFVAAILANFVQVGVMFVTEPLKMKGERINPINGAKRIFSLRALVELVKSLLKITIIASIVFVFLKNHFHELLDLIYVSPRAIMTVIGELIVKMGLYSAIGLVAIGILDYAYQKFDFERSIRMSKQEVKEEYKNIEGNPEIKSRIRQTQRELARRRMLEEIPEADVVITNPTHYAVCLKYNEEEHDAPVCVAKGVDYMALKIKEVAREHDVMIVENKPLAQALYAATDIGAAIPEEFFKAVAEILAYVYRMQGKV